MGERRLLLACDEMEKASACHALLLAPQHVRERETRGN